MIKIEFDSEEANDVCISRILIDRLVVCTFNHQNSDGIAICLRKAADAIELSDWAERTIRDDAKGG